MKKIRKLVVVTISTVLILTGCGNKKAEDETTEELTQVQITESSEETEEIIAEGSGQDTTATDTNAIATNTDTLEQLPDTMEPLDNDAIFNPTITGLSKMNPKSFNRDKLLDAVLSYMYKANINDDVCNKIEVTGYNLQGKHEYEMTLYFDKSEPKNVEAIWYNNTFYDIQTFVDDDDVGFDPDKEY